MIEHTTIVKENWVKKLKKNNDTEIQAAHDRLVEKKADITIQNYMDKCESESDDNDQQLSNGKKGSVTPKVKVTTSLNLHEMK